MTKLPAYQDIAVTYGCHAVALRPSLRAATRLERLHDGFPNLLTKIEEFDTLTVRDIICQAATDQAAANALIRSLTGQPLSQVKACTLAPAVELITALMTPTPATDTTPQPNETPMEWADLYASLYRMATGWLGWPPMTAWNATLPEILNAFDGKFEQLKAIHGSADNAQYTGPSQADRARNAELGLDPEFDRNALHALKGKGTLNRNTHAD